MFRDIADARTPRWSTSSLAVPIITATNWIDLRRPSSLFTIRLVMLSMPAHLSLATDIFLRTPRSVIRSYVCPLILFINNSNQIYYAAWPNSSTSSLSTPSSIIRDKTLLTIARTQCNADQKNQEMVNRVPCCSLSHKIQCGQRSMESSYHYYNREACQTSWNVIDLLHRLHIPAPLTNPLPSAPFCLAAAEGWNWLGVWWGTFCEEDICWVGISQTYNFLPCVCFSFRDVLWRNLR